LAYASDIEQGLKAGAHAYITKPGNLDDLLTTIKRLLSREYRQSSGSGGKAERTSSQPVSDQPLRTAEASRETQIPGGSGRHRSIIPIARTMRGSGVYGSATG
jgi:DNA-binding response OmpR family regulator